MGHGRGDGGYFFELSVCLWSDSLLLLDGKDRPFELCLDALTKIFELSILVLSAT